MSKPQLEVGKTPTSASKNIASLLLCFLLMVSICLTAFNLYLFAWIWTNFNGGQPLGFAGHSAGGGQSARQRPAAGLISAMKLMRQQDENVIQLHNSRLIGDKLLKLKRVEGVDESDQAEGRSSALRFASKSEIRLVGEPDGGQAIGFASLIASGQHGHLSFPNGLIVRDRDTLRPLISCSPGARQLNDENNHANDANFCRLRSATVRLAGEQVDFAKKSVQLAQLRARRLHSPMNKLQLMCTNQTRLSSRDKQIDLQALESVSLGSRQSKVIIKAQTIDLGAKLIDTRPRRQARHAGYKLCICLASGSSESPERAGHSNNISSNSNSNSKERHKPMDDWKLGRVFAIQDHFECSHFARFCQREAPI